MKDQTILHYGIKRRSGRYPWGSGENPYQRESWYFLREVDTYRGEGLTDKQIAGKLGITTTQLRNRITVANKEIKATQKRYVAQMHDEGMSNVDIAKKLGMSEGTVRNIIKKIESPQPNKIDATVEALKAGVERTGYLDVGLGVERQLGVSQEKLRVARQELLAQGYYEHKIYIRQLTDRDKTITMRVLTKEPDLEVVKANFDKIRDLEVYTRDNGRTYLHIPKPKNIKWDQIKINYAEDGGEDKDGLIELRKGAKDLDLGNSRYAQVRIAVDGTHYLKGMAMHTDSQFPDGVDIIFNTNKKRGTPRTDVLKQMKDSDDNPFGATIKDFKGALNIVNEEGDWSSWSSRFSSQFLSKQPLSLVKDRLKSTYENVRKEYLELNSLTNPIVKEHLLGAFADGLDMKAAKLQAESLARTKNHVLLPFPNMDPTQVYAPNYNDGERVVLIRHPHGGIFEIPELTVNNRGPARKVLGMAVDAIGIHPSVAKKLSGADFDGDHVLVIPNNNKRIKSARSLADLKDFDPMKYQVGYETLSKQYTQKQMGIVSNLITDMSIKNAPLSDIARAVKHSMVVIDANKHRLDYKQSEIDNGIAALKKKYMFHIDPITGKKSTGASTIVSKSSSEVYVERGHLEKMNPPRKKSYANPSTLVKTQRMNLVSDAHSLSSGRPVEKLYADYANKLKALKNRTHKSLDAIPKATRDPKAASLYRKEVSTLNEKLNKAELNRPRERQAQIAARVTYYRNWNKDMTADDKKKLKTQALVGARAIHKPDASAVEITITPKEWQAIQARAISPTKVRKILEFTNMDRVREYATPKKTPTLSSPRVARIKSLSRRGYTYAEIAQSVGVSVSQVQLALADD